MKKATVIFLLLSMMVVSAQMAVAQNLKRDKALVPKDSVALAKTSKNQAKQAKKQKSQEAKKTAKAAAAAPTDKDVVYLFGVGFSFNDTVFYMTDIVPVKRLALQKRTKFLPYRSEFSLQWREYLEGTLDLDNQTTSVFYATKRKKISKRYYKMKRRCLNDLHRKMVVIGKEQFRFTLPQFVSDAAE